MAARLTLLYYQKLLENLKKKIRQARYSAAIKVNTELLHIYWEIGNTILKHQQQKGWGAKVIDRLATDLRNAFPGMKGLSVRNIKYMRAFAAAYPDFGKKVKPVSGTKSRMRLKNAIVQAPLAQLSWYHHITILDKIKDESARLFYIHKTAENGWSRNMMLHQLQSGLHRRQGNAITNFEFTLSKPQSDLASETLKSPYLFDFLDIHEEMQERDLEKMLIEHIKKFMLELGRGFAYVGNQYNLQVEEDDFFLDLLFFNYHLSCFVVFELKIGAFKPEFAGKLNFYINTVDEEIKEEHHLPTIGVLLCRAPNKTVVRYALKGVTTPIGVADYTLTTALPQNLKAGMPSADELQKEFRKKILLLPNKKVSVSKGKLKKSPKKAGRKNRRS